MCVCAREYACVDRKIEIFTHVCFLCMTAFLFQRIHLGNKAYSSEGAVFVKSKAHTPAHVMPKRFNISDFYRSSRPSWKAMLPKSDAAAGNNNSMDSSDGFPSHEDNAEIPDKNNTNATGANDGKSSSDTSGRRKSVAICYVGETRTFAMVRGAASEREHPSERNNTWSESPLSM